MVKPSEEQLEIIRVFVLTTIYQAVLTLGGLFAILCPFEYEAFDPDSEEFQSRYYKRTKLFSLFRQSNDAFAMTLSSAIGMAHLESFPNPGKEMVRLLDGAHLALRGTGKGPDNEEEGLLS